MELLTLAGIGTIILTAALSHGTEMILDEGTDQLKKIVKRKSPETFKQLEAAAENPQVLPETVEMMATLIEEDEEVKEVAEKVAEENKNNADIMNQLVKIKQTGLEDFEAEELEGEIDNKTKVITQTQTDIEQMGAKGVKIKGKATIKTKNSVE
jgi:hypothetical protein